MRKYEEYLKDKKAEMLVELYNFSKEFPLSEIETKTCLLLIKRMVQKEFWVVRKII